MLYVEEKEVGKRDARYKAPRQLPPQEAAAKVSRSTLSAIRDSKLLMRMNRGVTSATAHLGLLHNVYSCGYILNNVATMVRIIFLDDSPKLSKLMTIRRHATPKKPKACSSVSAKRKPQTWASSTRAVLVVPR